MHDSIRQLAPSEFPVLLREIADPPSVLYLRGTLPEEDQKFLCVVGSREVTAYGKAVCEKIIRELAGSPIVIVSGLALGIDAIAHQAALHAGLTTIAVPGSGLSNSVLYPRTNVHLAHEILSRGGALLSEFEPDFRATPYGFPQRNRIMAGLSHAILVIEAKEESGTLITARLATDYNRDVFTVPGSIFHPSSFGPHMLLRHGAALVRCGDDVREALGLATPEKIMQDFSRLSKREQEVLTLLENPKPRDVLIETLGIPAREANVLIAGLELKGIVVERMGAIHIASSTY